MTPGPDDSVAPPGSIRGASRQVTDRLLPSPGSQTTLPHLEPLRSSQAIEDAGATASGVEGSESVPGAAHTTRTRTVGLVAFSRAAVVADTTRYDV